MAVYVEQRKKTRFRVGPLCTNPYPAHMHDPVEIAIVRRGYINMTINGTTYAMEPDTVMIVFPGMIHSYDSVSEDADGLFVGFTPDSVDEFRNALISMWPVVPMVKMSDCPAESSVQLLPSATPVAGLEMPTTPASRSVRIRGKAALIANSIILIRTALEKSPSDFNSGS